MRCSPVAGRGSCSFGRADWSHFVDHRGRGHSGPTWQWRAMGGASGNSNFITERGFTGVRCRAHEGGGVPGAAGTLEWGEEIAHGREGSEGGTGGFLRWNLEEKRKGGEWRGGSVPSNGPHAAGRAARPHHVASGGDTERDRGKGGQQVGPDCQ
jgi:hypothetical protein